MIAFYYSISWAKRADYQHMLNIVDRAVSEGLINLGRNLYVTAQMDYLGMSYRDGRYISKNHLIYLYNNIPNWRKMAY